MKLTRFQISVCPTREALIELHQAYYPHSNKGSSIAWANHIMKGRESKLMQKASKETKPAVYWQDCY